MLAGIKTGKKKRKAAPVTVAVADADADEANSDNICNSTRCDSDDKNASAADHLRASLLAGTSAATSNKSNTVDFLGGGASSCLARPHAHPHARPHARPHHDIQQGSTTAEADLTVRELWMREKTATESAQEHEARNVMRRGKTKRHFKEAMDSDEEEERQMIATGLSQKKQDNNTKNCKKASQRDRARQMAQYDRQDQITAHCHWWLESCQFDRQRLLALGNCVSLVLAPEHESVSQYHCYLVPIPHAPSWTACDVDAWDELRRFQASLRRMAQAQGMAVLFYETVLPTASSSSNFWQTRMEAVWVPPTVAADADAPLYITTALAEQAEEWGTHQKLMKTGGRNSSGAGAAHKELRATVPINFAYFYIEHGADSEGFVQLIESRSFPKDFGADTVLGMMRKDPLRFGSRNRTNNSNQTKPQQQSPNAERQRIQQFLQDWKPFDWTTELDPSG